MAVTVRQATGRALYLCGHIAPDATYTTTAKQVTDIAITKLAHVMASDGGINQSREAKYYGMALPLLAELQAGLCHEENVFEAVRPPASMTSVLSLSDDNAGRVLPAALAMSFALADQNILAYDALSQEYYQAKLPTLAVLVTGDQNKYAKVAPEYCNLLQAELLHYEGSHTGVDPLAGLDDYLSLTDDTALRVLPLGLAKLFSLIDGDTALFQEYAAEYAAFRQSICAGPTAVGDRYGALSDPNMQG